MWETDIIVLVLNMSFQHGLIIVSKGLPCQIGVALQVLHFRAS